MPTWLVALLSFLLGGFFGMAIAACFKINKEE